MESDAPQFLTSCFDALPQPEVFCSEIEFNAQGHPIRKRSTTVNAGSLEQRSEIVNVEYRMPERFFGFPGSVSLGLQATHKPLQTTTLAGTTTRTDGTIGLPKWSARLDARYRNGPWGLFYTANIQPSALVTPASTVENSLDGGPRIAGGWRHDLIGQYTREKYTLRAGVYNLTDEIPTYLARCYGTPFGRLVFASLTAEC